MIPRVSLMDHDVVVAARFGINVALRPDPFAAAGGAHVGKERNAGRMASLALLADQEARAAGFMGRERFVLFRAAVLERRTTSIE